MTASSLNTTDDRLLVGQLTAIGRRRLVRGQTVLAIDLVTMSMGVLLGTLLLDAVWPLSPLLRVVVISHLFVVMAVHRLRVHFRRRLPSDPLAEVGRLERRLAIPLNVLINAFWLGRRRQAVEGDPLTAALAQRTIDRGETAAATIDPRKLVSGRPIARAAGRLGAVAAAWLIALALCPTLVLGGVSRLIDPWGGHRPFGLTRVSVEVRPGTRVDYGSDATVVATTSGPLVGYAELVEVGPRGKAPNRMAMRQVDSGRFEGRVLHVDQTLTFCVQTPGGWSKRITIEPDLPRVPTMTPDPNAAGGTAVGGQMWQALQRRAASQQLAGLADKARRLAQQAVDAMAAEPNEQIDALADQAAALTGGAKALSARLSKLASSSPAARQTMQQAAGQLDDLAISKVDPSMGGPAAFASGVRVAALRDERILRDEYEKLAYALSPGTVRGSGQTASDPGGDSVAPPLPSGVVRAAAERGPGAAGVPEAVITRAPSRYRRLVALYFDRVAKDQIKP